MAATKQRAALCWGLAVVLLWTPEVAAQQLTPFQGRNKPPNGGVDVYVSPVVDKLVQVSEHASNNAFLVRR
jgi:hypothetical protein